MARLPDADVQRLKTEISLVRLVEAGACGDAPGQGCRDPLPVPRGG